MPETNSIYEEPSRLSQGLIVGLSISVVAMGAWLVATIWLSQSATNTLESDTDAAAAAPVAAPTEGAALSVTADATRQPTRSVHFDWPEFDSPAASSTPPQAALPVAPELPANRDLGRLMAWPAAAPVPETRGPRQPSAAAPEATDAIVDILAPAVPPARGAAAAPPPRQAQRRQQRPRAESEAAQ